MPPVLLRPFDGGVVYLEGQDWCVAAEILPNLSFGMCMSAFNCKSRFTVALAKRQSESDRGIYRTKICIKESESLT